MPKEEPIVLNGVVRQALANARVSVGVVTGHTVVAHISGKMRKFFIRILPGDTVRVEMSPYDLSQGRIVYRDKT